MAFNEQVYGSDFDTDRDYSEPDQGLAAIRHNATDRRGDNRIEEAHEFRAAWAVANRRLNPTPTQRHLDALAFAAAEIRRLTGAGRVFQSEVQQYLALHESKRAQLGRYVPTTECEALRAASRAIWNARQALVDRTIARAS